MDDLRRLAAAATPGPWKNADPIDGPGESMIYGGDGWAVGSTTMRTDDDYIEACRAKGREPIPSLLNHRPLGRWNDDARLIIAAVNALPALLDIAEAARGFVEADDALRAWDENAASEFHSTGWVIPSEESDPIVKRHVNAFAALEAALRMLEEAK